MIRFLVLLIALAIVRISQAQVPGLGPCPKTTIVQNFNVQRYLGKWYEVRKYPFIFTIGGRCVTADYGLNANQTVSVFNAQIRNGQRDTITGLARIVSPNRGQLAVTFPSAPSFFQRQAVANYDILYTDYDQLAVVFSCNSLLNLVNGKVVWILSRTRDPPPHVIQKAYEVLKQNNIATTYLSETDNKNCP